MFTLAKPMKTPKRETTPLEAARQSLLGPGMPISKAEEQYRRMREKALRKGDAVTKQGLAARKFGKEVLRNVTNKASKFFGIEPQYDYKHDDIHAQLNGDIEDARDIDGIRQYINTNTLIKQQILQNMYQYILDMGRNPEESGIIITDDGITGISDNDVIRVVINYLCDEPELAVTNIDDAQLQEYALKACGTEMENIEEVPENPNPHRYSPRIPKEAVVIGPMAQETAVSGPSTPFNRDFARKVNLAMVPALNNLEEELKQNYYKLSEKELAEKYDLIMAQEPEYGKSMEQRVELEAVKDIYNERAARLAEMQKKAKWGGKKTKKSNKSKKTHKTKSKKSRKSKSKKQRK
jgi:hypothetical protein